MNYKIPFLVSLIALAGSLYWGFSQKTETLDNNGSQNNPKCLGDGGLIALTPLPDSALQWIANYDAYIEDVTIEKEKTTVEAVALNKKPKFRMPKNKKIKSFTLQRCELETMVALLEEGAEVEALLIAKEIEYFDKEKKKRTEFAIDLLFKGPLAKNGIGDDIRMDDEGDGYFDFTHPCPPVCGG